MKANIYDLQPIDMFPDSWTSPDTGITYTKAFLDGLSVAERKILGWHDVIDNVPTTSAKDKVEKLPLEFNGTEIEQNYAVSDYSLSELEDIRVDALATIDDSAEICRLRYITPGAGQSLVYSEKAEQASDFIAAGSPSDLSPYPLIQIEVDITGSPPEEAANNILSLKSNWLAKATLIEGCRLTAKRDIANATSAVEINNIVTTSIAALDSL